MSTILTGSNVVATVEGNLVSSAVVTVTAGSLPEALDRALTRLDRFCDLRDLTVPATSYSVVPLPDNSYEVTIVC